MAISANPTLNHRRIHVQKDPSGKVIGAAVYLHAAAIEPFLFGDPEYFELEIEPRAEGIMLLVRGDEP